MIASPVTLLNVSLYSPKQWRPVGRLALVQRRIVFEYDADFIATGLALSPFHLPLRTGVQTAEPALFGGLPGVFEDSLPDGWGRLLLDRQLRRQGIVTQTLTPLDRLACVGDHGVGALRYQPAEPPAAETVASVDLDTLAGQAQRVLQDDAEVVLDALLTLNGSSSGARPKVLLDVSDDRQALHYSADDTPAGFTPWLIKFPASSDPDDIGAIEFAYAKMAAAAGIDMMPVHLFPQTAGAGYFGVQRFDRHGRHRVHVHTACGLLNADFRMPSLDYRDLLAAAWQLTRDQRDVASLYRQAVFNVLTHNRDDHSKNFAFLMDSTGRWRPAPAYDLTFSNGPGGEHSTTVMGEGHHPGRSHLLDLASAVSLSSALAKTVIDEVGSAVERWPILAREAGVSTASVRSIASHLQN